MYSRALGGAVRRRTPSLLLCSLTMLDGSGFKILSTQPQITLRVCNCAFFPSKAPCFFFVFVFYFFYFCSSVSAERVDVMLLARVGLFFRAPAFRESGAFIDLLLVFWSPSHRTCLFMTWEDHCWGFFWLPVCRSVCGSCKYSFLVWAAVDNNLSGGRVQTVPLMSALFGGGGHKLGRNVSTNRSVSLKPSHCAQ